METIGLERGKVRLFSHREEWDREGERCAALLRDLFGEKAAGAEHVGSTSVPTIKAKPIIDLAVAVHDFADAEGLVPRLAEAGFIRRPWSDGPNELLFVAEDAAAVLRTHHLHIVKEGSAEWTDYLAFRDCLRADPKLAAGYEALKESLAKRYPEDRKAYTEGKAAFIRSVLRDEAAKRALGTTVDIVMDRPVGSGHPKRPEIVYPINYGYVPGLIAPDGEEQDVYLLGVDAPLEQAKGEIVAVVRRKNDVEDKWVAVPPGMRFAHEEIERAVAFQEKYYDVYFLFADEMK